jgi:hypothetical protein
MQNSKILKRDLKVFVLTLFFTGVFILLFSLIGHVLTPGKLIPSSFAGGTIGLVLGLYLCFRHHYIERVNIFPVILCSLISLGVASFLSSFNFNHPIIILGSFFSIGLIAVASNHYFVRYSISKNKLYGTLGLILVLPALYFVVASLLKFQLGYNSLFGVIEILLNKPNGQANFNAITPYLFGGGLLLSFGLNILCQLEIDNVIKIRLKALNFTVLILAGLTGLAILAYLAFENLV